MRTPSPSRLSQRSQVTVVPYHAFDEPSFDPHYYVSPSTVTASLPTVVPRAPSPPSPSEESYPEFYGPDRYYGPPVLLGDDRPNPFYPQRAEPSVGTFGSEYHYEPQHLASSAGHGANPDLLFPLYPAPIFSLDSPGIRFEHLHHPQPQAPPIMASLFGAGAAAVDPRAFKDDLTLAAGYVTPGVDDTPYIQYALDALTRTRSMREGTISSDSSYPLDHMVEPHALVPNGDMPPVSSPPPVHISRSARYPMTGGQPPVAVQHDDSRRESDMSTLSGELSAPPPPPPPKTTTKGPARERSWRSVRVDKMGVEGFRPLKHKPAILRLPAMVAFILACTFMLVGTMFCAIYSAVHSGLWAYSGTIYDGRYFLFRIFPQLLGAIVLLWAQAIILATFRLYPFACLASNEPRFRLNAIHVDLYPRSFLWPQLIGTWQIRIPIVTTWLANFTVPLLSAAFTLDWSQGEWRWAAVTGVMWTLVALYVLLLVTAIIVTVYWSDRRTGLLWDARSIADVIAMLPGCNTMAKYLGADVLSNSDLKVQLRNGIEKLGWWWMEDPAEPMWYGLGIASDEQDLKVYDIEDPVHHKPTPAPSITSEERRQNPEAYEVRRRYLPWCMRFNQLLFFVVTGAVLLIALYIVSFIPPTDIRHGFRPWVPAGPRDGAFSAANFLYSFLPALLGMVCFLLFQALDLTLRTLEPWAELGRHPIEGVPASRSLLADYAAALPFQRSWHAARNGHWRVAVISLLATLFVLIPVLAGGMFQALTRPARDDRPEEVLMFPQVPTYALVLTLLTLLLLALCMILPGREDFKLPHQVTNLAGIISFCANRALREDWAFQDIRSRDQLVARLDGMSKDPWNTSRWALTTVDHTPVKGKGMAYPKGSYPHDDEGYNRLSIRRMPRYTASPRTRQARSRRAAAAARERMISGPSLIV